MTTASVALPKLVPALASVFRYKLLIFKPSAHWQYAGGAIIIIAEDIAHAQKLLSMHVENGYPCVDLHLYDREPLRPLHWDYVHCFVLVESFDVVQYPRVVLVNYRCA